MGKEKRSIIYDFFNGQWIGVTIGIVSILVSVYLFKLSDRQGELVYFAESVELNTIDFPSFLKLDEKEKNDFRNKISKIKISIWNNGKNTINSDNILEPIKINIGMDRQIVRTKIIYSSRTKNRVRIDPENYKTGTFGVGWDMLPHDDGAVIEVDFKGVIFSDEAHYFPYMDGEIEGQGMPRRARDKILWQERLGFWGDVRVGLIVNIFLSLFLVGLILVLAIGLYYTMRGEGYGSPEDIWVFIGGIFTLIIVGGFAYSFIAGLFFLEKPPF